jgi:hypothetical protein
MQDDEPTDSLTACEPALRVIVVGGGPAGMTVALLLARKGHHVMLLESERHLGGLWSSKLDENGCFESENSCKVFQSTYRSVPAIFELIGCDWRDHFVPRHDLNSAWLRPLLKDLSWRDLTILSASYAKFACGLRSFREISVEEYLELHGISEPGRAWLRATALGGISGTLGMTVWELFHRTSANVRSIFSREGGQGVLYWNARPPNAPSGFVSLWRAELERLGVEVHTEAHVSSMHTVASGVQLVLTDGVAHTADAAFLAITPRSLRRLLSASGPPMIDSFGITRPLLESKLHESVYEHYGIAWFFDVSFPNDLPLGGHNVRRNWHPILVQYSQYEAYLPPPAMTVVIASISLDASFIHSVRGKRASDYSPDELAHILWEDERLVDPTLPKPCRHTYSPRTGSNTRRTHDCRRRNTSSQTPLLTRVRCPPAVRTGYTASRTPLKYSPTARCRQRRTAYPSTSQPASTVHLRTSQRRWSRPCKPAPARPPTLTPPSSAVCQEAFVRGCGPRSHCGGSLGGDTSSCPLPWLGPRRSVCGTH